MGLIIAGLLFGGALWLIGRMMDNVERSARIRRHREEIEELRRQGRWRD